MISDPITISTGCTVAEAINLMKEYRIAEYLLLTQWHTERNCHYTRSEIENNFSRSISEVMTIDLITTNQHTNLSAAARILQKHKIENFHWLTKKGN